MTLIQNFFNSNKKWLVVTMTILVGIAYLANFNGYPQLFNIAMLTVAVMGGIPIVLRAVSALRYKIISIELLVSIAVISAIVISEFSEAGIVIWLFTIGDVLEAMTLAKTRNAIKALVQMAPKKAIKITDDAAKTQLEVAIDDVVVGDQLLVKPGSQVPVDGHVVNGSGHVNEASITGESKPSHKRTNSHVFAGTVLKSGTLFVEAEKVGEDTAFGKLIEIVEEAQDSQTATQRFIDRFSQRYTPFVLITAIIVGLISQDFKLAITILVLGCPGALVIGVPVSTVTGIGSAAKQGIIVKGSSVLDELRKVNTFVFDKTGTLTTGQPNVGDVQNFAGRQQDNLKILASVEHYSDHPLAKAILNYYSATDFFEVAESKIIDGRGIQAVINGDDVLVGNERLLNEHSIATTPVHLPETSSHVLLAVNGQLRLALEVKDPLRPNVSEALAQLRKLNQAELILLSGDNQSVAEATVAGLEFAKVQGNFLPEDKASYIQQLRMKGRRVAFIGDGINDSPALAAANVGIAMGSGTDVAIETADIVLVQSQISKLAFTVKYAKSVIRNMYQNIAIAILTVILLFIGLFTGYIYMASGMLVHELSILIVVLNGMRLLKK
ncbi:heavy metal translocating P-type ATPase [Leuconostoc lactis]|uniref:heavy metal translocating P-type ATPase n=1 Tax=Leuconostoc lactis TaxID=1246 RepID=UPI0024ACBFFE|nr:cation-translocating P-type ATPase [Leuconostoc lactis]MDI6495675.1 cation-translocating P-type ATPase [Leuconostoc lactis]